MLSAQMNMPGWAPAGAMADLSLDIQVDPQTAAKIREVNAKKEAAVAHEDYDEAKRLKGAIERLRVVGQKVGEVCADPFAQY